LTIEDVENMFPDMVRGQRWEGIYAKYRFICEKHGEYLQTFSKHKYYEQGCQKCGYVRMADSHRSDISEMESLCPEMVRGQAWSSRAVYRFLCPTHGEYSQLWGAHKTTRLLGHDCPKCAYTHTGQTNALTIEEAETRYPDMVKGQTWTDIKSRYKFTCRRHGKYEQRADDHQAGARCPKCKSSRGEARVARILDSLKVAYARQFRTPKCRNKGALPFDFSVNVDGDFRLIEFHGQQHYEPCERFGGTEVFQRQQWRDQIKEEFCQQEKIPLLVIPYSEPDLHGTIKQFVAS
jgi:Zn finger protein HypA/HybF involved in hydrogenase expression